MNYKHAKDVFVYCFIELLLLCTESYHSLKMIVFSRYNSYKSVLGYNNGWFIVHLIKYLDYLETLAQTTGMRTLCEAVADAVAASDVGLNATLDEYMIQVGTEFRNMVLSMGKDITEYAVNEAFKQNSEYVLKAFEASISPKIVAVKMYGDAMVIPPKSSYVAPMHYTVAPEDGSIEKRQYPIVAESVVGTISDYAKKHAIALAIGAALGAGVTVGAPKAIDAVGEVRNAVHKSIDESNKMYNTLSRVGQWNFTGARIGDRKNWTYVDYKDKPGIYGPHLNGISLEQIEHSPNPIYASNEPLEIGWWVSHDGYEVFSTVTGKYFKPAKSFYDADFKREDLGDPVGVGGHYILPEQDCFDWDNEAYYGKGNY